MASAITVKTSPPEYNPVYNPINICVYESDATSRGKTNYKYIIYLTIQSGAGLGDEFQFQVPLGTSDNLFYGVQDVSRVLEKYIVENLPPVTLDSGFVAAQDSPIIEFDLDVYSGWDVAGVFTEDPDGVGAVSVRTRYCWSASFQHHDWIDQQNEATPFNTWLCNATNGTSAKFLSNNPDFKARLTDLGYTYALTDDPGNIDLMVMKTYDSSDNVIDSIEISNPLGATPVANRIWCVSTAPGSLNNIQNGYITGALQPIIGSDVAYYTIYLDKTGAGGESSETITVTIEEDCRYESYRLHFLNELGGFDYFNFLSKSQLSSSVKRKTYTKSEVLIETAGINYENRYNGKADYYVESVDKLKLRSDYVTAAQMDWLKELIESPLVFLEFENTKGDKDYKPLVVTTSRWVQKVDSIDKLFKLELDVDFSHLNQRQRR